MKSSVRILAIALALAFLLLARTAFQDSTVSADEHIDLDDGEAAFADLIDGAVEAEYLGLEDGSTSTVYFYIQSDDLGTQNTASTTITLASGGNFDATNYQVTLPVGTAVAGTVATSAIATALDTAYCVPLSTTTVAWTGAPVPAGTPVPVIDVPDGWALGADTAAATIATCTTAREAAGLSAAMTTTDQDRDEMAVGIQTEVNDADATRADDANHGIYEYGSDPYSEVSEQLRYTHGANGIMAGGTGRPLDSVTATRVSNDSDVLTFVTNKVDRVFQDISRSLINGEALQVDATFDIVDMYPAEDDTGPNADYNAYGSGYARAYVSSGSDSGLWVTIEEVAAVNGDHDAGESATSNLYRGMVVITNDTGLDDLNDDGADDTIYVQDGDTLSLQVFDENGNRSSDVLASATATIDDSAPTISDLDPADESILNDETLRISFSVNDEGAGIDFKDVPSVVTMVEVQARDESLDTTDKGTGAPCELASGEVDIGNAGGNASRVGILIAPSSTDFTDRCGAVVDTSFDGDNGDGKKFNLIITAQDLAGNVTVHTSQLTIDGDDPEVEGNPTAGQAWDDDENEPMSSSNSILVQFNESLDVDTVEVSDFSVTGYTIDSVDVVGTNDDNGDQNLNEYVVLTLTEDLANNARPSVSVSDVSDVAGNSIDDTTRTSENKIKTEITVVPFAALIAEDGEQAISFTTDEALRSKSGENSTEASVGDKKLKVTVANDTMGGDATFKQSTFKSSRAYGVMLQAVDVDGNASKAGAVSVSGEPYELTEAVASGGLFDVTLDNWPLADTGFDNDVAGEVKAYIGKTMVASSTGEVDWVGGDVELQASAGRSFAVGETIRLSYSYVNADQVIQVDDKAPTMTSTPADNSETDYAAGVIQFSWNDAGEDDKGEYAGDTYKTVTLSEASHEGPDGESMDILDMLTTNDNKTWVLRPDGEFALGVHEFTLTASDAAGNEAEVSVTITVIERKPVEIGLNPGWNLISFRGAPASLDVNDIFSSDTVSVVSQYDGRRVSPWTVWTRGSDGSLSSSPAGRTTIDSGLGLYVLSSDGSPLEVDIAGTSRDNPAQVPPSIELIPGWNLVAVIIIDRDQDEVEANDYLPSGVWTRAFRLSMTTGELESISPSGDAMLMAGEALWVYASKEGVIVPK